ncbi:glycoside hydrolase family 3 protein [Actinocatenispora rupis]|uniref:Glycosyl hydrolase n=1 Tax=Actinocatenispora rupis TaxID=519421 RepID=A0A8J3N821_9ACTN|nr:glycoside hydrolase family 3 C-terminal domain-containing protein [Actinocatenispora rupis]GID09844.1 glycosyl hydrolase [Actinocatenispora rupis]
MTDIRDLVDRLTLEEKVGLLTGRDFWTTRPAPAIGLRSMVVSDGPSGVRGPRWDEREPSLNLPSATALSAAWDLDLARAYGAALAAEARRKGVDVVLGPTVNLHRSPLGGRHFEAYSEDPELTAAVAVAYVKGLQDNGIGATPKHYVANDYETERFTADTVVGERALRELYLLPFERAVVDGGAWLVMSAYNSVNGVTASENDLLETPLNTEWGFDGVVVSDWTAVRSLAAARAAQDLVMPGPDGPWGDALVAAVRAGDIAESVVDRKVERLLRLASRVGALGTPTPPDPASSTDPASTPAADGVALARRVASAGSVLVANDGVLPLDRAALSSVAVIGHNARLARTQGGGSATVLPDRVVSPEAGIRAALPGVDVRYATGAVVQEGVAELPLAQLTNPVTGGRGVRARFLAGGAELYAEDRRTTALTWLGATAAPVAESDTLELHTRYVPTESGRASLGFAAVGTVRIFVDGVLAHERTLEPVGTDLGAALLSPPASTFEVDLVADTPVDLRVEYDIADRTGALAGMLSCTVGRGPDRADPEALIAAAAETAAACDVAVVVVGTNNRVESEGYDRADLALPGRQDDLVRAVLAANPRTVVVVNAGAPVVLPWADDAAAVLLTWFGGQEYGDALADVLLGAVEPGGRLPTTWPAAQADVPVLDVTPVDGRLCYDEGIHVGYRAWLRAGATPAWPFGHGLGYTTFAYDAVTAEVAADGTVTLRVTVTNSGARRGRTVVQAYAARPESTVDRPVRWLVGFAGVTADPGATRTVTITVPPRALAYWDGAWQYETGPVDLLVGRSATDLALTTTVTLS